MDGMQEGDIVEPAARAQAVPIDVFPPDAPPDLHSVLGAWNDATVRLTRTHEALRAEVRRLTQELEVKNRKLARENRLADLGRMATHVAHEVRNSLVPVKLYLSLLRRRLWQDPGSLNVLGKIESGFASLEATVQDLLNFTSDRDPTPRVLSALDVITDICSDLAPQLAAHGIELTLDIPPGISLTADEEMFRRAILNLLLNALDAMPDGGDLVVTGWQGPNGTEIEVADSGPGLPREDLGRIFEPFYSTKSGGTGLGLAIVQRIVSAHQGAVIAANCPEGGAAFTLRFPPRAQRAAA